MSIIQNQMALMGQHLQLLNSVNTGLNPTLAINQAFIKEPLLEEGNKKPIPANSASSQKEKRGVLGNFSSKVELSVEKEASNEKKKYIENLIKDFNERSPKTKEHVQKYRKSLADNRVSAGFRPNTKEMIYPIHCYKAKGSKFTDLDGHEYIDFTMGFGVNLFGHSPDFIETAILEQIKLGMCVGPQAFLAGEVAELVCELTGLERTVFVNSGTEAVMTAIRLARAATKKDKIVIFDGSYHGHFDGVLARAQDNLKSIPVAGGISENLIKDVVVLDYGSSESLEIIKKMAPQLAAVLVEPVQSRFPENQPKEFLNELRQITQQNNIAFIWDEVITGFRIHPGGAQAYFGIKADLATYGKVLGGGMPIGAVAGAAKYLDYIDGGYWQFGDDSYPSNEMTFFAGTFCKHPLAMAAAKATLKMLKADGLKIIEDVNKKTKILCESLNQFFEEKGLDLKVFNFGTLFRFKGNLNLDLFFARMNQQGFYIWEGRNLFLSTAHTDKDIADFKKATFNSLEELISSGHYKTKVGSSTVSEKKSHYDLIPQQQRFLKVSNFSSAGFSASLVCISAKVKGPLNIDKLKQAFEIILNGRDIFKLRFNLESAQQWFSSNAGDLDFEFKSLREASRPWRELDQDLTELSKVKIDLSKECSLKVRVYDVVSETHVMAIVCHHLAFDGWTMTLFFEELADVYNTLLKGENVKLVSRLNYEEFLPQALNWRNSERIQNASNYWLNKFERKNPAIKFLEEYKTKSEPFLGQRIVFDLELKLYKELKVWSTKNKVTPFMFLLGAYGHILMSKFKLEEIVIGIPAAHRDFKGSEKMFGNCANLLPVRLRNYPNIEEFFKNLKTVVIEAYQNLDYPYEALKEKTGPLFEIYFNLEPTSDLPEFDEASLIIHPFPISASELPLMLNVTDLEHYYHCEFDFQLSHTNDDFILELVDELKELIGKITTI